MPGKIIAIIDDEPLMVDMISTYLRLKGYQVHGAYSGKEGLELVQSTKPDVLLLDLMLPDIDGYRLCEMLRETPAFAALPVLIVSARTDQASMERATRAGANGYLTKPVRFPALLQELDRLLKG